ncbi:hypothetical protein ACWDZ4_09695 [Streptomyces sp. NPDC003016]
MMPATLAVQLPPASLREGIDLFGYPSPDPEPVRVEVQVRACLSFADLLGLLTFTGGVCILDEELSDDSVIRDSLQYALMRTDLDEMEKYGQKAVAAYHGALPDEGIPIDYMRRLGTAITRVFGVTA